MMIRCIRLGAFAAVGRDGSLPLSLFIDGARLMPTVRNGLRQHHAGVQLWDNANATKPIPPIFMKNGAKQP